MSIKGASINLRFETVKEFEIESERYLGALDYGVRKHLSHFSYHWDPDEYNITILGAGPLYGLLPGTKRLVGVYRSPVNGILTLSTLGGASIELLKSGFDLVEIHAKCPRKSILVINDGKIEIIPYGRVPESAYALQEELRQEFMDRFPYPFRILGTGPAGHYTCFGAALSKHIKNGRFDRGSEGWMGRGGLGSVMGRVHNLVAIVFGGTHRPRRPALLSDSRRLNELARKHFSKGYMKVAYDATTKYRFDPNTGTGGTLGNNLFEAQSETPSFNFQMIYLSREARQQLWSKYIKPHFFQPFQQDTIEPKRQKTCGENCPAVCKKYRGDLKKDAEPYLWGGTLAGILYMNDAERLVRALDDIGVDAIEGGAQVCCLMEALWRGWIPLEDAGIDERPNMDPDPGCYSRADSEKNARIAEKLAYDLGLQRTKLSTHFREGFRKGVRILTDKYGHSFKDIAVYSCFGDERSNAPNPYWNPGFLMPSPFLSRFCTYYKEGFFEPEEYGAKIADSIVSELINENFGLCRFHRKWLTGFVGPLFKEAYGIDLDPYKFCKELAARMIEYDHKSYYLPAPWESERVIDLVATYASKLAEAGNETARNWSDRFVKDKHKTALEYWTRARRAILAYFGRDANL